MIRTWIRSKLPTSEQIDSIPVLRRFKPLLSHPNLWAINRRSVAGGVAAGLFCGLIPGPFQILGSLAWALIGKINLPVAVVVTFYTNPLTIVPLYVFAVAYGQLLLGEVGQSSPVVHAPEFTGMDLPNYLHALGAWVWSLGPSLAVGLPATMLTFAALGYVSVRLLWNVGIRLAVFRRRKRGRASIHS